MADPPPVTREVGGYELIRELGRGGMAVVYLARQLDLDRGVAVKELGSFQAGSPESAQRFLREARLVGSLSHPNIVVVHEYFEQDGVPYIAMEYVERGSLRPYVGRLTLAQFAGVMEGVLAGLAHAEQAGVIHRDLKPENILGHGRGAREDRRLRDCQSHSDGGHDLGVDGDGCGHRYAGLHGT